MRGQNLAQIIPAGWWLLGPMMLPVASPLRPLMLFTLLAFVYLSQIPQMEGSQVLG